MDTSQNVTFTTTRKWEGGGSEEGKRIEEKNLQQGGTRIEDEGAWKDLQRNWATNTWKYARWKKRAGRDS